MPWYTIDHARRDAQRQAVEKARLLDKPQTSKLVTGLAHPPEGSKMNIMQTLCALQSATLAAELGPDAKQLAQEHAMGKFKSCAQSH